MPKCPKDMVNYGKVSFPHTTDNIDKTGFDKSLFRKIDNKWSWITGNLCCDMKGVYDYIPKDGLFYSEKCPLNSENVGETALYFDKNDVDLNDNFKFKLGVRTETNIWANPLLCRATQDLPLDNPDIYMHGQRCQGVWRDVAKSGFLMNNNYVRTSPFEYSQPYNYEEWYVQPKLCQVDPGIAEKINKCTKIKKSANGDPLDPTPECDVIMLDYCSKKDNKDSEVCACINSKLTKVGSPICIDKKCKEKGYKTTGMTTFKCDLFMTPFKCSQYYDLKDLYPESDLELVNNKYTAECLKPPPPLEVPIFKKTYPVDPRPRRDDFIFYLIGGFILFLFFLNKIFKH